MSLGHCAAVLKTASRANPAVHLPYCPRGRVTPRTASRNVRHYDWSASSGSVVANDPVNFSDPSGLCGGQVINGAITVCATPVRKKCGFFCSIGRFFGGGGGSSSNASLVAPGAFQGGGSAPPPLLPPPPLAQPAAQTKTAPEPQNGNGKTSALRCLGEVAAAGAIGALNPVSVIMDVADSISGAQNRTSRADSRPQTNEERVRSGGRLTRDWGSAVRIGIRRFVGSLVPAPPIARVVSGAAAAGWKLASSPSCGIEAIPGPPDILPLGF